MMLGRTLDEAMSNINKMKTPKVECPRCSYLIYLADDATPKQSCGGRIRCDAEDRIERLRKALAELVGAETKEDLEAMEVAMRMMPGIEADKSAGINAIHALLSEVPQKETK